MGNFQFICGFDILIGGSGMPLNLTKLPPNDKSYGQGGKMQNRISKLTLNKNIRESGGKLTQDTEKEKTESE